MKPIFWLSLISLILTGNLGKIALASVNTIASVEQQAQSLYETGRYQEAITVLNNLINTYQTERNMLAEAQALANLALVYQEIGNIPEAQSAISKSLSLISPQNQNLQTSKLLASTLEIQGKIQLSINQSEAAIKTWQQVEEIYQNLDNLAGITRSKIYQALAMRRLGLHNRALKTLEENQAIFEQQPDSKLKATSLQQLGDTFRTLGHLEQSENTLNQALKIAENISDSYLISSIFLSLGNTKRFQQDYSSALKFYQQAAQTNNLNLQTKAQTNQLRLLSESAKNSPDINILISKIETNLTQLPINRDTINIQINLAQSLSNLGDLKGGAEHLAIAIKQAKMLGDQRSLAYALGELGHLYELQNQWEEAQKLTTEAIKITESFQGADLAYRWQWQLGRILKTQGNLEAAILAYSQAVNNLQSLRSDLVSSNTEVQFSFRESVEPVYREYVSLLLAKNQEVDQEKLKKARDVMESLQLAELDDFFRDACLDAKPMQIDQADQNAAVIYPIILSDRLEVIASLPNQPLQRYTTYLSSTEVEETIDKLRTRITRQYRIPPLFNSHLYPAQELYNWLIKPLEPLLKSSSIESVVFVLDGSLRNIPMSVLHDGQKYLMEQYNIALTPGLQLLDVKPLQRENFGVLAAGISEARQNFAPLPNVESELKQIQETTQSQVLLNETFTKNNFQKTMAELPFPVVHLATHGQFSSQAENTFILTWDGVITATELDSLLRSDSNQKKPIELLILSACQTAAGDKRAALGLAGIATRAGARSTVASLWSVSDEATSLLMSKFYQELVNSQIPKSEALRNAQKALLNSENFAHPYYWSAFVMVGNWR